MKVVYNMPIRRDRSHYKAHDGSSLGGGLLLLAYLQQQPQRQARGKVETLVMRRRQSSATNFSWHSSSVVLVLETKQNYSREPFKIPRN